MDYASIVETIEQLQEHRHAAVFQSPPFELLAERERELRTRLRATREHRQDQAAWRRRVEANKLRRTRVVGEDPTPLECA